jgi:YjbE family integral membrane protein
VALEGLGAFVSVVVIDVVLAGDNAIVVGMAASGFEAAQRRRIILWGTLAATALRILLATVVTQLLAIIGLTLAGGLLLLWVSWKFYRDLSDGAVTAAAATGAEVVPTGNLPRAVLRVVLADLSMSLDNVLAVAGTARDHLWVLIAGLSLSVALMALASELMAWLIARHRWIAWIGLGIVTFVALRMIYEGWGEVATWLSGTSPRSPNWVS